MFPVDNLGQTGNINSIHSPSFNGGYGGLGGIGILGLLGIGTTILNHELAGAENEEARTWQEDMYNKQMDFNASQAEIARLWQEKFYNQYNSPQALMSQYKEAGFNPILATGISPSNPPSASSASVSQPSAVSHLGESTLSQMIGQVYNMLSLKSDLQLKDAQISNYEADSAKKLTEADLNKTASDLNISKKEYIELQRTFDPYKWANEIKQGDLNLSLTKAQITAVESSVLKMDSETLRNIVESYCKQYNLKLTDAEYALLKQKNLTEQAVTKLTWAKKETEGTIQMKNFADAMRGNPEPEDKTWSNVLPVIIGAVSAYFLKGSGPKPVGGFRAY